MVRVTLWDRVQFYFEDRCLWAYTRREALKRAIARPHYMSKD